MTHTHHPGMVKMFRIKLDRKHYAEVFLWDTKLNMWAAFPHVDHVDKPYYGLATVNPYVIHKSGKAEVAHKFGEIHMIDLEYGPTTVAHEIMHLINYWVHAFDWNWDRKDEKIAELCGSIHHQFWHEHYQLHPVEDLEIQRLKEQIGVASS
jgi:hypothetical protein